MLTKPIVHFTIYHLSSDLYNLVEFIILKYNFKIHFHHKVFLKSLSIDNCITYR